jgi:K+-transporting ATPase ATPase C chain
MKTVLTALRLLIVLAIVTGVIYPLVVTLGASVLAPGEAAGSLISRDGQVVGSSLIGQTPFQVDDAGNIVNAEAFADYFWARPSVVNALLSAAPGELLASGASNLGPTSATLQAQVQAREAAFRTANSVPPDTAVPADMLFASGSGLDPDISPESALLQVERVAEARGLDVEDVTTLVDQHIERPLLNFIGPRRVNVLALNLALDALDSGPE